MHRSGINVSSDLISIFQSINNENGKKKLMKINIINESFVSDSLFDFSSSLHDAFSTISSNLSKNISHACYFIMPINNKYLLLSYVPLNCNVRDKMLYASSRNSLKEGLNAPLFLDDYFLSDILDCNYDSYLLSLRGDERDVMTMDELKKKEDSYTSVATNVKAVALPSLPLEITDSANKAINDILNNTKSVYLFHLNKDDQSLNAAELKLNKLFPDLTNHLKNETEPCYILYNFTHDSKTMTMFVYFCPDVSDRKFRMVYASCKSRMLELCEKLKVDISKKFEVDNADDVNEKAVMDELFPKVVEKQAFSKPSRPGKGGARMH